MRSLLVIVLHVAPKNAVKMSGTEDQQPVEAVSANRLHPALGEGVGVRSPDRRADDPNPLGCEDIIEGARELGVAIADEEVQRLTAFIERETEVARTVACRLRRRSREPEPGIEVAVQSSASIDSVG